MRFSVSRFNEAQLYFGHGSDNAWDEAAYLLLHTLHLPLDRLDPFMDARLTRDELDGALKVIERRIRPLDQHRHRARPDRRFAIAELAGGIAAPSSATGRCSSGRSDGCCRHRCA